MVGIEKSRGRKKDAIGRKRKGREASVGREEADDVM